MRKAPELDTALQVRSHQGRIKGLSPLPHPAGHTFFDAAQDMVGFSAAGAHCLVMLSFSSTNTRKYFSSGLSLNSFSAQPVFVLGITPTHVQDLALDLVELHEVCTGPCLQLFQFLLDGIVSFQRVDCTTQLGVIGKLAEGALNPTVHVTDKDIRQYQFPSGMPLVTGLHLDIELLTATL